MLANETEGSTPARTGAGSVPRWLLLAVSFWGGFQIMALEICGFRVLQTNLGSSVIVTGTLLTIVMVLLSAGYYFGGLMSSRLAGLKELFVLLMLSALYTTLVTAVLSEPVAALAASIRTALGEHVYLRTGLPAAVVSLLLYGPPVFVMSMISPCLIRLTTDLTRAHGDAGVTSGFFMSLSTLGSIAGTMLSSYLLIPFFGVTASAIASSGVFLALTCLGWLMSSALAPRAWILRTLGVSCVFGACVALGGAEPRDPSVVYQEESHYGELQVRKEVDDAGREVLTYHPSRVYTHSILYPAEPLRDFEGTMYLVPGLLRPPRSVLVLGSAAGGVLRSLEQAFPDARITGLDLDPKVHEVATQVFGVNPRRSELVTADARVYLSESRDVYDLIIVDLFAGEFIPPHCISLEFFKLVRARLAPTGAVFVNTNMNDIHHELEQAEQPFRALRHLEATLFAAGFPGLFENSFFHSLFAFPDPVTAAELRRELFALLADHTREPALRAAAGVAAYTTAEVPRARERYRPYTDRWTPTFLIELKSNASAILDALERQRSEPRGPASATPADRIAELVLRRGLEDWKQSGEPDLVALGPLVHLLNGLEGEVERTDIDIAAKYFRFSSELGGDDVPALSPWARVSSLYAKLHALGRANDYESVLAILEDLNGQLGRARG